MSKHPEKFHEMNRTHVSTNNKTIVYQGFFSVEEHSLSYKKFNTQESNQKWSYLFANYKRSSI